jgi:hypothetical protein
MASVLRSPRIFAVLAVTAVGVIAAGCEAEVDVGGSQVNKDDAQNTIKRQYTDQYPDITLTSIDCESTDAKVGNTFTCAAENSSGMKLDIDAKINEVDESDETVKFRWTVVKAVSDGSAYEKPAVNALRKAGTPVTSIDCPTFEIVKGHVVACDATMDDGSTEKAVITLTNGNGGFRVRLAGPPDAIN